MYAQRWIVCKSADVAFRILLALNIVSLILDTMQDSVNAVLNTMDFKLKQLPYITVNSVFHHT